MNDRKESEEEKKYFKTNVLVPREEGATVAATPTFSHSAGRFVFRWAERADNREIQTIGKYS